MKILSRCGSTVIIEDKEGRIWLTRRKKRKHNNRRQKPTHRAVIYIPIKQLL